jgi:hypothetical protein
MITHGKIERTTRVVLDLAASDAEECLILLYSGGVCIERQRVSWQIAMTHLHQFRVKVINSNPNFVDNEDDEDSYDESDSDFG